MEFTWHEVRLVMPIALPPSKQAAHDHAVRPMTYRSKCLQLPNVMKKMNHSQYSDCIVTMIQMHDNDADNDDDGVC